METKRKPKCYNCIHSGQTFKISKVTHQHCEHPSFTEEGFNNGDWCAWDTLNKFSDTCEKHEFKIKKDESNK